MKILILLQEVTAKAVDMVKFKFIMIISLYILTSDILMTKTQSNSI